MNWFRTCRTSICTSYNKYIAMRSQGLYWTCAEEVLSWKLLIPNRDVALRSQPWKVWKLQIAKGKFLYPFEVARMSKSVSPSSGPKIL